MATIQFLGATGTVTGSKYVVEAAGERLMIDCGLFQGAKELRERNWQPLPVPPSSINWLVLTHAHLDHIGYIPRMINDGFHGQVLASSPTVELAKLVLPDSGHLQEEDAEHANYKGFSRHKPALPLYTYEDAVKALNQFRAIDDTKKVVDLAVEVTPGPQYRFGSMEIKGLDLHAVYEVKRLWTMQPGRPFNAEYPDYFLNKLREDGIFDNLGKTEALLKRNDPELTVDVTLVFQPPKPPAQPVQEGGL